MPLCGSYINIVGWETIISQISHRTYAQCSRWLVTAVKPWQQEFCLVRDIWSGCFPESSGQLPLTLLERSFMTCIIAVRSLSLFHVACFLQIYISGSIISELYVVSWFLILIAIFVFNNSLAPWLAIMLVCYRLVDSLNYRLCIIFVDRYKKGWGLRSLNRSLILLFVNYLEIIVGFATLYLITESIGYESGDALSSRLDALYFSVITITTLGYGDIKPFVNTGKWLSLTETIMGFVLVVLVVGTFLTGVQDIHNLDKESVKKD